MQGPLGEDFTRITTRSSQRDLYKIMQGPLRDLLERFSLGSPQDLLLEEPVQDHGRTSQRGLYQDVLYTFSRWLCLKMWGIRYTLSMAIYHIVWMCCLSVGKPRCYTLVDDGLCRLVTAFLALDAGMSYTAERNVQNFFCRASKVENEPSSIPSRWHCEGSTATIADW